MDWSIQDIAKVAGTTSRTLRHYDSVGLLEPSRIGSNGYRYYDEDALATLQRILMLRDLGLSIPAIADVLSGQRDHAVALRQHLAWLQQEKDRLDHQIESVQTTITKMEGGEQLMAEEMFKGFDHTQYKDEVEQRWGKDAYANSDAWWRSMTDEQKAGWMQLGRRPRSRLDRGGPGRCGSVERRGAGARAAPVRLAQGHPGHARLPGRPDEGVLRRTRPTCTSQTRGSCRTTAASEGATFVRDAMRAFAEANL